MATIGCVGKQVLRQVARRQPQVAQAFGEEPWLRAASASRQRNAPCPRAPITAMSGCPSAAHSANTPTMAARAVLAL